MKLKSLLNEKYLGFGNQGRRIVNEQITVGPPILPKKYVISISDGNLKISDGRKTKVYKLEAKGYDLTVTKLIKQGVKFIMGVSAAYGLKKIQQVLNPDTFKAVASGFEGIKKVFTVTGPENTITFTQIA